MSNELLKAITVTAEVMGRELSADSLDLFERELSIYPLADVLKALERVRREVRHGLNIADVVDRIPGGHPGVEEAWAIVSKALNDEGVTMVQTREMCTAFGVALGLQNDEVAARMAFKEIYQRETAEARARGDVRPKWTVSLGHDAARREGPLRAAVEAGRITLEQAQRFLPAPLVVSGEVATLVATAVKRLANETDRRGDS